MQCKSVHAIENITRRLRVLTLAGDDSSLAKVSVRVFVMEAVNNVIPDPLIHQETKIGDWCCIKGFQALGSHGFVKWLWEHIECGMYELD